MDQKLLPKLISFTVLVLLFTLTMITLNKSEIEVTQHMSDAEKVLYYTSEIETGFLINFFYALFFLGFLFGAYEILSNLISRYIK